MLTILLHLLTIAYYSCLPYEPYATTYEHMGVLFRLAIDTLQVELFDRRDEHRMHGGVTSSVSNSKRV